jgi:hypothetical protein
MNIPKRQGNIPAEAVGELQSLDFLEIVEALKPRTGNAAGEAEVSNVSIAPVGLDLMPDRAPMRDLERAEEEAAPTVGVPRSARRRRIGLLLGAVAGCALIVVAAGIARVGHASSAPSPAVAQQTETAAATSTPPAENVAPLAALPAVEAAPAPAPPDGSSTGTVRLASGLKPGRVLFDGKKLPTASTVVSCGTHQIKIGRGRAHSVDVPCGSEILVSK